MSTINDYKVGMTVYGRITGIKPYGAFVAFDNDVNGLIHISELSNGFVRDIANYVNVDDYVMLKVIDIDKDEPGILQKLGTVTAQHNINITHFIVTRYSGLQIVIRTDETDDMKVTNILTSNGFIVSDHRTNKN